MGLQKKLEALQYIVLSKKFLHSKYNKKTQDGQHLVSPTLRGKIFSESIINITLNFFYDKK